ncbi:hypothetical protein OEZ86_007754 [Tetradesmus obliquus]|nr:hypothetical protein OEZ86_007754 [Tetradesmus obliquus]
MSYNVLADELAQSHQGELYRGTHPECLHWPRRWGMMRQEIADLAPDVVCLQAIDHWDEMSRDLYAMGYQGSYAQRSGGRSDGCATFWRASCFEAVAVEQLSFNEFDLRDNGWVDCLRQQRKNMAGSDELSSNLLQQRNGAYGNAGSSRSAGWSIEELITATGGLHNLHLKHYQEQEQQQQQEQKLQQQQQRRQLYLQTPLKKQKAAAAGLQQQQQQQLLQQQQVTLGSGRPPVPPPAQQQQAQQQQQQQQQQPPFTLQDGKAWHAGRWDEPLPAFMGDGVARHGLQLRSCYAELTGSEPQYTSCHDAFFGTVDYIWYTPQAGQRVLHPVAVLLPPDPEAHLLHMARPCMPNETIPSDHVCLLCDFELS